MVAPAQVDIDGSPVGATLDACFLFFAALPLGYWAAATRWKDPVTRVGLGIVAVAMILALGEGTIFGLATPRWWEVLGQVAGVGCGSWLASILAYRRPPVGPRTT